MSSMMDIPREFESEVETEYIFEKSVVIEISDSDFEENLKISNISQKKNIGKNYFLVSIFQKFRIGYTEIIILRFRF